MHNFIRLARQYLRPHLWVMLGVLLLAMVSSMSSFTLTYMRKVMVDDVLQVRVGGAGEVGSQASFRDAGPRRRDTGGSRMDTASRRDVSRGGPDQGRDALEDRLHLLWMILAGFVAIRFLFAGVGWAYTYLITRIGQAVVLRMRQDVYDKLQSLQVSYFDRYQTGKIMARVMDDVNAVQWSISGLFIRLFIDVSTLIVGVAILFQIHVGLATLTLCTLPFYLVAYRFFIKRIRLINRLIRERNAATYGSIGDSVRGVRVVMAFARELRELRRFFSAISDFLRLQIRNSILNTALSVLCGLISGVGSTLVVYYGILAIRSGDMTLGEFLYFYGSIGFLFSPIISLSNMNIMLQWVTAALYRVFEVLDEKLQIEEPEGAVQLTDLHGEVVFHKVSLQYPDQEDYALEQISFGVFPGQLVCIVGSSGAGKSSLVNLLLRLYEPTEGRITVDGEDLKDVSLASLRKHIRMVPQEPILFSGTLADNIRYGYPAATPEQIVAAAKAAELHDFIIEQPGKYESHIGEAGVSLSGGQKQRMAMAMTLITDPSVLILDDSTSALDAKTEARIHKTLDRVMEGRTSFLISHKVAMCRKADLILVLNRGRLVERGTHERLLAEGGEYYRLFETQLNDEEKALAQGESVLA
jgi:ATP-binding cassette, subfamily B, bacterial MsbA